MEESKHNINLDILRIVAAIMVVTVHVGAQFPSTADITNVGQRGVEIFFVLSGLLTLQSVEHSTSIIDFFKKELLK